MFFILFFSVAFFSILNCKPITISSQKLLDESNCTIPLSILESKFEGINSTSPKSFLVPLQTCKTMKDDNVLKLCEETFAVLYNISTCNSELVPDVNFEYKVNITDISGDICNDFQNQSFVGKDNPQNIGSVLKIKLACELICGEKMHSICEVLLWGYKVQRILRGEHADSKNEMLSTKYSAFNQLIKSSSVTSFSIHPPSVTGTNVDITQMVTSPIVEGRKFDPLNNQLSDEATFPVQKQKTSKLDSSKQNNIVETPKFKTNDGNFKNNPFFIQNTTFSKSDIKKINNVKSTETLNNSKTDTSNHSLDGKVSDLASKLNQSNFINNAIPNDDEDSNIEIENEDDDYPTLDNLPQARGQDSEIANQESSAKFRIKSENLSSKIDNHQEEGAFTSNVENKLSQGNSTNFIKTSNATLLVEDVDIKVQEYESNDQFSASAVQPTHQDLISEELPSVAEGPSDLSTDEASKILTENEKSTLNQAMFNDPDYEFSPAGGSETQRFDMSASKFAEGTFRSGNQILFPEQEDTHFFFYFLSIILIVVTCYLVFHNKQKIIALIVEGCHERRRRPHGVNYRKLETK